LTDVNLAQSDESPRSRRYMPRKFGQFSKARFYKDRNRELFAHCGGQPSYAERILIGRIVRNEWDLIRQDARLDAGDELSGHASRARFAMENRLRLDLRDLGLKGTASGPKGPNLSDYLRDLAARPADEPEDPDEPAPASPAVGPQGQADDPAPDIAPKAEMAPGARAGGHGEAA
jgi:hypothetical protein